MKYLTDTNILLRLVDSQSLHHSEAKNAVDKLLKNGDTLFITLQNISEFWNVCTRPRDKNGLGFSVAETDGEVTKIEQVFDLQVHDAKIAAAMKAHNIENLLTFNAKDFKRYPDIKAVEPKDV